ncbi:TBC-domain-containing protein [Hymenopellis radicata]|nr:TBC-domain-containing protein [Hymenopellis radicata]
MSPSSGSRAHHHVRRMSGRRYLTVTWLSPPPMESHLSVDGCDDAPRSRPTLCSSTALQDFSLTLTSTPADDLLLLTVVFKIIPSHQAIGSCGLILADRVSRTGSLCFLLRVFNTNYFQHRLSMLALVSSDTSLRRRLHLARMAIYSSTLTTIMATVVNDTFNLSSSSASTLTTTKALDTAFTFKNRSRWSSPTRLCGRILVVSTSFNYSASRCKDARISLADFEPRPTPQTLNPSQVFERANVLETDATISSHHLVNVLKTISHQDLLNLFKTVSSQPPRDHPTTTSSTSSVSREPSSPQHAPTLRNFKEPTKEQLTEIFFSLPPTPTPAPSSNGKDSPTEDVERMDINAVLSLGIQGEEDSYAGKLYLLAPYLAFASLDRKSVRFTLPLSTVRRVERLNARAGIYALSLALWDGGKIIVQLTSLRPTADLFCSLLRDALKIELQRGQMKAVKGFVKTCYSETLISAASSVADGEREDGSLISEEKENPEPRESTYHGGLGLRFKFPGDPKKLREASKIKLWTTYLRTHGRNLTLLRYPQCTRLVQVGLPNRLRGEMWETLSGSIFMRYANPGYYEQLLKDNEGRTSTSTEDIEKDLHRSLPEYAGYQSEEGIGALRRVLQAYSFKNPSWVTVSYMSEEQAFWLLEVLCDRCFLAITRKYLPSSTSRSNFLIKPFDARFINSMPMIFAFRIVDCFFCMGPKVLFQVGLAILKINGEKLLTVQDDGHFLKRFRGEIIHSNRIVLKAVGSSKFYAPSAVSTKNKLDISTTPSTERCASILLLRWRFPPPSLLTPADGTEEKPETRIGLKTFQYFLSEIASWARDERIVSNGFQNKDGFLTKDEVLTLSESFLFIFRFEIGDAYLGAVSRFMTNAFEYGDALLPEAEEDGGPTSFPSNQNLATDESYNFFVSDSCAVCALFVRLELPLSFRTSVVVKLSRKNARSPTEFPLPKVQVVQTNKYGYPRRYYGGP